MNEQFYAFEELALSRRKDALLLDFVWYAVSEFVMASPIAPNQLLRYGVSIRSLAACMCFLHVIESSP